MYTARDSSLIVNTVELKIPLPQRILSRNPFYLLNDHIIYLPKQNIWTFCCLRPIFKKNYRTKLNYYFFIWSTKLVGDKKQDKRIFGCNKFRRFIEDLVFFESIHWRTYDPKNAIINWSKNHFVMSYWTLLCTFSLSFWAFLIPNILFLL